MAATKKKPQPKEKITADNYDAKAGRMSNTERDKKQKDALGLFIRGYSLQSISEMENIKVGVPTLSRWAKDHNWEEQKQLQNISPAEIKAMILKNVAAIKQGKEMPYKPDDISKLAAAWERMDDNKKKAVYSMESFDQFMDWFMDKCAKTRVIKKREANLELLKVVRELQDEYIATLL